MKPQIKYLRKLQLHDDNVLKLSPQLNILQNNILSVHLWNSPGDFGWGVAIPVTPVCLYASIQDWCWYQTSPCFGLINHLKWSRYRFLWLAHWVFDMSYGFCDRKTDLRKLKLNHGLNILISGHTLIKKK